MAYYLQFDGANDFVSTTNSNLYQQWRMVVDVDLSGVGDGNGYLLAVGKAASRGRNGILYNISGGVATITGIRSDLDEIIFASPIAVSGRFTFEMEGDNTTKTMVVTVDGVEKLNQGGLFDPRLNVKKIFETTNAEVALYRIQVYDGTDTLTIDYNPSSSNGTGSILPDDAGSFDGTLVNFPTDDSQWVFYSDGPSADIIAPVAIGSGESFGTTLVTTGQVLISPTAISSSEVLGSPVVQQGATFLSPITIPTSEVVGSPIVTPLGVTLQPVVITTEGQVGEPVILAGITLISPTNIGTNESVNQPRVDLLLKQIFPNTVPPTIQVTNPNVLGGDSITIPLASRATWNAVAKYLRGLNFKGQDNDVIQAWLLSEGFDLAYNDNWFDYLVSVGYIEGAYNDKIKAWKEG